MKAIIITGVAGVLSLATIFLGLGFLAPANRTIVHEDTDQFIEVEGTRIRYRMVDHTGPAVIMLHGFGGDLLDWGPLMQKIDCAKVISLDLVGFGGSDKPALTYDLETQQKYLVAFMDRMNIRKAVLVGTSMGASIALWTASRSPERVAGLVVFAPSAYPGSMRHRWPGDWFYRPNLLNSFARYLASMKLFEMIFPNSLGRQALDVTASYDGRFLEALSKVHQPLLLVWSRGDQRVPYSYSERYRELLPQAQFIEAPEKAGHEAAGHPTPEIVEGMCRLIATSVRL